MGRLFFLKSLKNLEAKTKAFNFTLQHTLRDKAMQRRNFLKVLPALGLLPSLTAKAGLNVQAPKQVLLLGDSMRLGYGQFLGHLFSGASVISPAENLGSSASLLAKLPELLKQHQPAVVHLNAGLYDVCTHTYTSSGKKRDISLAEYKANVRAILETVKSQSNAKIIWATTTPVNEKQSNVTHAVWQDSGKINKDIALYNQAAIEVCQEEGVMVNDLYQASLGELENFRALDGIHFTPEGNALLAQVVSEGNAKVLG